MQQDTDELNLLERTYASVGKLPDYPSIEESTATLAELLDDTASLFTEMTAQGPAAIRGFDGLVLAALVRSRSLTTGFLAMIDQRNKLCAQPMIRFQLDSAMRLVACVLAEEPEKLVQHMLEGGRPARFKDVNGEPLTDHRLHTALSQTYPEASRVYEDSSGFVHLSARHIAGIWDATQSRPGKPVFTEPDALPFWDELQVRATMTAFVWATSCVLDLCFKWHQGQSETTAIEPRSGNDTAGPTSSQETSAACGDAE
jgi:hypothetical protein